MGRLLVGISELQQHRLAVGQPKERDADREIVAREPRPHLIEAARIRDVFNAGTPRVLS
jgi:hypothetical protein